MPRAQQIVRVLCVLLRIAESLDRSHAGLVDAARFRLDGAKRLILEVNGHDCQLELWGVQAHQNAVEKVFDRKLVVEDGGFLDRITRIYWNSAVAASLYGCVADSARYI